eukprot:CAMPEP_0115531090 /NCGR_PEP_ID=MMETSP0271-20121206/84848_1 /TAXON_ID=71861 /ORGANISM="Scrippsiella trochoidea, Strain CCMP3099" /LENGTH=394 /DNA_ID=CAMNT_0002963273 /DNA_START=8 /DNA_END=1192 /DNA_ORIENTATION=+
MAAAADLELGAQESRTLLAVEGEALTEDSSAVPAAAVAEEPKWRWPSRLAVAALAVLGLVAGCICTLVVSGAARPPAQYGSHHTDAVQGKQLLASEAAAAKPPPGCPMLGSLPQLWSPAAEEPPLQLKVFSYNLFWWKLFDKGQFAQPNFHLNTHGNTATELLARAADAEPFDVMGFQECKDEGWLLAQAGLADKYEIFRDKHSCMAYNRSSWSLLSKGVQWVAQDSQYGERPAQWMRLKHGETGRVLFFVNHHGPIPINSGGECGGEAVAHSILHLVKAKASVGDAVVLTGDFNSDTRSVTIRQLQEHLKPAFRGTAYGGVDHIFSNLGEGSLVSSKNWGDGGSDHDALSAVLQVGEEKLDPSGSSPAEAKARKEIDVVPTVVSYSGFGGFPR